MISQGSAGATRIWSAALVAVMLAVAAALIVAAPAFAEAPVWSITSATAPTHIAPGGEGELVVTAVDLGDAMADGNTSEIVVGDTVPAGLTVTEIEGRSNGRGRYRYMTCTTTPAQCVFDETVSPYEPLEVHIHVKAGNTSATLTNNATVTGGGTQKASASSPVAISSEPVAFGVEKYEMKAINEDGSEDTQAGSHPFELTTTLRLTTRPAVKGVGAEHGAEQVGLAKDLHFNLPPGIIGNPTVVPQCTDRLFASYGNDGPNLCPNDTVVGVASVSLINVEDNEEGTFVVPLFNLVPSIGEPAKFGFEVDATPVILDTSLRSGSDYGVVVSVNNISQIAGFVANQVTFWGAPADSRHNFSRGWKCVGEEFGLGTCGESGTQAGQLAQPFLTLPTSCGAALETSVEADSWAEPGKFALGNYTFQDLEGTPVGMVGCNDLDFEPSVSLAPDGQAGSTPTGLTVGIHVPQEATLNPTGTAEADVKNTTVALPEGVALNPAAADGLEACSTSQAGFTGMEATTQTALFTPSAVSCPEASKIGTVEINTPLLPNPLTGAVYLAAQNQNPFGSLVAMYLTAEDPISGVRVKLAGEVKLSEDGQVVSTFANTPQLPFEDLHLKFFGTARAPLNTPALCGTYTTTAAIEPWAGGAPVTPSSSFQVISGPNGSPCANPLPFAPSLTGGTTSVLAGQLSPFTMTMSREDGNQPLQGIQLRMPPGLSGLLTGVKLCEEGQADAGTCGRESEIGETIISVGLGGDPYSVKGGKVFLTGPYAGAPFGLSIVNPAKAGPYDLGQGPCDCVVVRARIEVDPITAALTITTDNSGPYKIPTILDGIPLQIKHVNVTINRPGFTFNPTNCKPQAITGAISSTQGGSSAVSVPFQVTNCAALAFKPGFAVSTSGKTSRKDGASLHVKLTYPKGSFGVQANIATVKVDLPKQLPSRLTTLQQACTVETFEANPAACPANSRVGVAKATTPLLPVPLTGPAYFVSHGGAKFPELVIVLSGYGVTVQLHAETFISKAGITSSTFRTVPDVPVGSFELSLPEGPYSALAANGNLCKTKLAMPTAFTAQNGAVIHQSTPISSTGCPKAKKAGKGKGAARKGNGHKTVHGRR
jgi:hypothetical protein